MDRVGAQYVSDYAGASNSPATEVFAVVPYSDDAWQVNATGTQIRAAVNSLDSWGYAPHNLNLYSETTGKFVAAGGTPPTLGTDTLATKPADTITFTSSMTAGYANSRAERTAGGWTCTANVTYYVTCRLKLSRALTGAEAIVVYHTGMGALGTLTINSSNSSSFTGATGAAASGSGSVGGSGAEYLVIYLSSAVGSDLVVTVTEVQVNVGPFALTYVPTTSAALGPTTPGWLLPGLGGARLNDTCRTSVAMQLGSDGTYTYAPHNLVVNSMFAGAVAGSPGTAPTNFSFVVSTGSIASVTPLSDGSNAIACSVSTQRLCWNVAFSVAAYTTYTFSILVVANNGIPANNMLLLNTPPTGSTTSNYYFDGVLGVGATKPTAGQVLSLVLTVGATAGSVGFRIGPGVSGNGTGTCTIARPLVVLGSNVITPYIPTTTAAKYGPAFDYISAVSAYGLRSEPAATNVLTYSTQFDNAAWVLDGISAFGSGSVANAVASPDGTVTADKITEDTSASALHRVSYSLSGLTNAATYTVSLFAQPAGRTKIEIALSTAAVGRTFDVSTGVSSVGVFISTAPVASTITFIGNGWYRISITFTASGTTDVLRLLLNNGSAVTYTGDGTSGIYLWGAQLETGAIATSPIITYGASATRAADTLTVPNTAIGWIGQTEGTVITDFYKTTTAPTGLYPGIFSVLTDSSNRHIAYIPPGGVGSATVEANVSGASQGTLVLTGVSGANRVGYAYATNNASAVENSNSLLTDTSWTVPATTQMYLGRADEYLNGYITQFRVLPRRLTDAQLRYLSALTQPATTVWQIDATGAQVRDSINDLTTWGYSPHNLLLQSQTFENASWTKTNSSVSADSVTAPDGTLTADSFIATGSSVAHQLIQTASVTGLKTSSLYVKAGTARYLQFVFGGGSDTSYAAVDAQTGQTAANGTLSATAIDVGNGWYRFIVCHDVHSASTQIEFCIVSSLSAARREANSLSGTIYIWGAQLNVGPSPLAYVATTSTALGPTAPGWTIPGVAGARLNGDARTSVAMQQAADGTYAFAPHNALSYSEQFDNAAWTKVRSSITANATTAPNGTNTAAKLVESLDVSSVDHVISRSNTTTALVSGSQYAASVYLKAAGRNFVRIYSNIQGGTRSFVVNLNTGDVTSSSMQTAPVVTNAGNGWWRVSYWQTADTTSTYTPYIVPQIVAGSDSYQGDGTSGIYVWGAQVNAGPAATAYVPTTTAARYGPAIDWLSAQSAYGLRSEPAATNLLLYSTQFDNGNWNKSRAAITADATTAPDGTTTADKLIATSTAGTHRVYQGYTKAASAILYTLSVYAKSANGGIYDTMRLQLTDAVEGNKTYCVFDLASGTASAPVDSGFTGGVASIRSVGNGWYRLILSSTTDTSTAVMSFIQTGDGTAGNDTSGTYIWGAQLETGSIATSPILTYGATATRAADTLVVPNTAAGWISAQGTVTVDCTAAQGAYPEIFELYSDQTNYLKLGKEISPSLTTTAYTLTSYLANVKNVDTTLDATGKLGFAYATNNTSATSNGATAQNDTSCAFPAWTEMDVGWSKANNGRNANAYVTRIRYSQTRVADGQLQVLTT